MHVSARALKNNLPTVRRANTHKTTSPSMPTTWAGRIPVLRPGTYADGMPLHEVKYLCCKLILRPTTSGRAKSLFDFAKVLQEPADQNDVTFSAGRCRNEPIQIREVLFVDTPDFRLYNNAFILRRRVRYEDGFPAGDPEIVFKFRHENMQTAAETDVRPQILGDHQVKFKCQALPTKGQLGGHPHVVLAQCAVPAFQRSENDVLSMGTMTKIFPVLERIRKDPNERITLVSNTIIEEVLQDIGTLDFGESIRAKVNIGLWRTRGEHRPLIGEFSFQIKFADRQELALDAMKRAEAFFIALQFAAQDWIALDATKTGIVYRLSGNAPTSHE
jgi:hypothetical protein